MKIAYSTRCLLAAVGTLVFVAPADGQERQERARFLDPSTEVTDDPRRIPVPPGPKGPDGVLVLVGGLVFDGTGTRAHEGTLVIERNKIAHVLQPGEEGWPDTARVMDVSGKFVMPGLIDMHTHLTYTEPGVPVSHALSETDQTLRAIERLRYFIESGITSVRDVGSAGEVPFRLKDWVRQRRLLGPRIFPGGQFITGTGGHAAEGLDAHAPGYGTIREASGPDDWREAVREQFKRGADFIKIGSHYSFEEVAAAVDEAHALGLKITADAETFYVTSAVEAGVDMIEHPLPRTDEAIRMMAEAGIEAVPTLIPYIYIFDLAGGYYGSTSRRFTFSKEDNLNVLRRMREAGIKMGIGTDLVSDWFLYLPHAYISELRQFIAVGYTPEEALVTATRTNAELLDMADKLGTLEPGKLADVLVVDGRPDRDIADLEKVDLVVRDGEVVVSGGDVVIPRHVPLPEPGAER
jgi:imidazolonepropionase-like amidohydrolase